MIFCVWLFSGLVFSVCQALPAMRTAPLECPLEDGNLLDVVLFAQNDAECRQMCQDNEKCIFYHFYRGAINDRAIDAEKVENQPAQCFLYDECNREVLAATEDCPLTKYAKNSKLAQISFKS